MKLVYQGDKLAAAVLDNEAEIRIVRFALGFALRADVDMDRDIRRALTEAHANLSAPAPE